MPSIRLARPCALSLFVLCLLGLSRSGRALPPAPLGPSGGEQPVLAALEIVGDGAVGGPELAYLTDLVRAEALRALPGYRVITRENLQEVLKVLGTDLDQCEGDCEVETGRLIGADMVVSGQQIKFGSRLKVTLKLHDTAEARLVSVAEAEARSIDGLDTALRSAAKRLLKPLQARYGRKPGHGDANRTTGHTVTGAGRKPVSTTPPTGTGKKDEPFEPYRGRRGASWNFEAGYVWSVYYPGDTSLRPKKSLGELKTTTRFRADKLLDTVNLHGVRVNGAVRYGAGPLGLRFKLGLAYQTARDLGAVSPLDPNGVGGEVSIDDVTRVDLQFGGGLTFDVWRFRFFADLDLAVAWLSIDGGHAWMDSATGLLEREGLQYEVAPSNDPSSAAEFVFGTRAGAAFYVLPKLYVAPAFHASFLMGTQLGADVVVGVTF